MRTVLLFALCILSSGAAGNFYKRLSAESGSASDSAGFPFFWFCPLFAGFLIPALAEGEGAVYAASFSLPPRFSSWNP